MLPALPWVEGVPWVVGCPSVSDGVVAQATASTASTASTAQKGARQAVQQPTPLLPDWAGPCLHRVVPTLLGELADPGATPLPRWFPHAAEGAGQVVLLVIDGLGEEQLQERRALAPVLTSGVGGPITSVAPSTTACALTTLVTGRVPAEHGVVGYRVAVDGDVMWDCAWRNDPAKGGATSTGPNDGNGGMMKYDLKTGRSVQYIDFLPGSCDPHGNAVLGGALYGCDCGIHPNWPRFASPTTGAIFRVDII